MAADTPSLLAAPPPELVAFRYAAYDVPFWARPNTLPGRWHQPGDGPTQYWALHPEAAWAEHIRQQELMTEADLDLVRMPFWVCRFPSIHVVDLRRSDECEEHGVGEEDLVDDDWTTCQELGARIRGRVRGVIAPCAALPERANLTVFGARRAIDWEREPGLASAVPTALVSIGRPPRNLVDRVRRSEGLPSNDRLF